LQTLIVDEDKLMDEIEKEIEDGEGEGGWVIDWHSTAGFAVRWIDLVVVLRCEETSVLYDRLRSRNYKENKLQENLDAEIFGVVSEEAREAWGDDAAAGQVVELNSVVAEDIEDNAERVLQWVKNWIEDRQGQNNRGDPTET
jgi:adenylate kinase